MSESKKDKRKRLRTQAREDADRAISAAFTNAGLKEENFSSDFDYEMYRQGANTRYTRCRLYDAKEFATWKKNQEVFREATKKKLGDILTTLGLDEKDIRVVKPRPLAEGFSICHMDLQNDDGTFDTFTRNEGRKFSTMAAIRDLKARTKTLTKSEAVKGARASKAAARAAYQKLKDNKRQARRDNFLSELSSSPELKAAYDFVLASPGDKKARDSFNSLREKLAKKAAAKAPKPKKTFSPA